MAETPQASTNFRYSTGIRDEDIAEVRAMIGQPLRIPQWNLEASIDTIRHYAFGLGDDNPLWCDEDYASRIQNAARDLNAVRSLDTAVDRLPLAKPLTTMKRSSGFGVRFDPFTGRPAFHAGQDFGGAYMTPVYATAPGVVAFTGVRSGYGNVVEVDHGGGFKTRYAHLQGISVARGQRVGVAQRIGAMGSTGRSTGVHLHYEIWVNGRVQDPNRFLKAGDYVQQNN